MISQGCLTTAEPIEEIVLDDSGTETSDDREAEIRIPTERLPFSNRAAKSLLKRNLFLRGLLPPERDKSYQEILNLPVVKRCCIEHSYFVRHRLRSSRYNFRELPATRATTLQFENEKSTEQPTIDVECLASKLNSVPVNDSLNKNNVNGRGKRNSFSSSSCSSRSGRGSSVDDTNDRDYCPEDNSTGSDTDIASVDSFDFAKEIPKTDSTEVSKNGPDTGEGVKRVTVNNTVSGKVPPRFYRVSFGTFKKMQKLLNAKCVSDKGTNCKIPPPRLKKMMAQRKGENILKMADCIFPMPNLTKMANGEKNWRLEYMDDEVQSLGLDDLLLKASELNAENFTKALGRKLEPVKTNFNNKDSSEIVFTIPKAKKSLEVSCEQEGDISKRSNLKTIKLDISKPFFESEKGKEPDTKSQEEISPKRPGIKVKTVENINEEFKDSLGRLNGLDKDISSGLDKTSFGVPAKEPEKNIQDELKGEGEGSRPFIMTIIQSKAEKQRPAILRNSYLKKKAAVDKVMTRERILEKTVECGVEGDSSGGKVTESDKSEENHRRAAPQILEKSLSRNVCGENYVALPKVFDDHDCDTIKVQEGEGRFTVKKRNIPFILNHNRKVRQGELPCISKTQGKLVKVSEGSEKPSLTDKTFKITSVEQKLGPKEMNRRFIKVVPYEPLSKSGSSAKATETVQQKLSDEEPESPQKDPKTNQVISLTAFAAILKEILPDKWFLCLDKKHGLQIIKTHIDEFLNPSILISMVIARCGKLTINVRGRQLPKSHELFSNLCSMTNPDNKLSLNYILAILNKLRHRSVCFGCDDPTLKKYWTDEGIVENQTEFQQVYRSHLCLLLVSLGKRRCYPCFRLNESLKKRYRRDKLGEKPKEEKEKDAKEVSEEVQQPEQTPKTLLQPRGVKRNLEDFLEESFSTMKQQIVDEIEKNKKLGERENALKAQEEVLSFMGLTRKESLDNPVRKSKRKKNSFYKLQPPVKKKTDQKELEFLEKYWTDINTLFSTSLLFGAYSRTGRGRLREKCRMFQKLLSTWKNIVTTNPEWIGEISLPEEFTDGDDSLGRDLNGDQFEKMDVPALRAYIINSVKEVNRIKHKLRTKNSYFKVLYNKFVKRRMKKPKSLGSNLQKTGHGSSTTNTPTPTDFSSDDNSRDKEKVVPAAEESEAVSGGDPAAAASATCVSDAD